MPKRKKSSSPNAPRLDPQKRILSRFYEPLILLCILGRTRGEHQPASLPNSTDVNNWPVKHVRRLFLNQLAFLCDHDTGGDSVTAIGLQHTPEQRVFWIAANACPSKKIANFFRSRLLQLKTVAESQVVSDESMDQFLAACIEHAKPRIKAYSLFFTRTLRACRGDLEHKASKDDSCESCPDSAKMMSVEIPLGKLLLVWLDKLSSQSGALEDLCKLAYKDRRCDEMLTLKNLCGEAHSQPERKSLQARCALLRHYVGRLGQYVKVVTMLLQSAPRLLDILDNFEVHVLSPPPRKSPPSVDGKMNLDGIAKRMLPAQSPDLARYQLALSEMDMRFSIYARYLDMYCDNNFKPRVHAEVQILDFFHREKLKFEGSDNFVACSKPACYCCSLYFHHHPLRPVMPASHQTIHKNWRPPDVVDGDDTQRDILIKMIEDVRAEVLHQINERRPNAQWHPDSTTGITDVTSRLLEQEIPEHLSELSHGSGDLGEISSVECSSSFDEETEDPDLHVDNRLYELDSLHIKSDPYSDWEGDSDESGGVALNSLAAETEAADDGEHF